MKTVPKSGPAHRLSSSPPPRNIAISLLRLAGCLNIARGLEYLSRRLDQILALLGLYRPRSERR